jgi:hypothetical protein
MKLRTVLLASVAGGVFAAGAWAQTRREQPRPTAAIIAALGFDPFALYAATLNTGTPSAGTTTAAMPTGTTTAGMPSGPGVTVTVRPPYRPPPRSPYRPPPRPPF